MKITKVQVKDILVRTFKTLLVVALTAFVTAWVSSGMTNVEASLIASLSAVGTMVLNVVIKLIKNLIDDWKLTAEDLADAFGGVEDDL